MQCCYSPLRYPGGKAKLYKFIEAAIKNSNCIDTYIEPFAGGGSYCNRVIGKWHSSECSY